MLGSGLRPQSPELMEQERHFSRLRMGTALGLPSRTLATSIQCSTTLALSRALMLGSPRQVVITQVATRWNCVMVARTVEDRCSLPGLFLWDQTEPRHWWGSTRLNSSWGERGRSPSPATPSSVSQPPAGVTGKD